MVITMKTYSNENVITVMSARIHPADKTVPDCKCVLTLTDRRLVVSEDNYDGTFTDHYDISIRSIEDIIESTPDENKKQPAPGSAADLTKGRDSEAYRQKAPGRLNRIKRPAKYLEIIYIDDDFIKQHLFFDECDKSPKQFIKEFRKI